MEMTVVWTDSAITDIQDIHFYYLSNANHKTAEKITNDLVTQTLLLERTPRMRQAEELLHHRKEEIRYLVEDNYKIVYMIDENFIGISKNNLF